MKRAVVKLWPISEERERKKERERERERDRERERGQVYGSCISECGMEIVE